MDLSCLIEITERSFGKRSHFFRVMEGERTIGFSLTLLCDERVTLEWRDDILTVFVTGETFQRGEKFYGSARQSILLKVVDFRKESSPSEMDSPSKIDSPSITNIPDEPNQDLERRKKYLEECLVSKTPDFSWSFQNLPDVDLFIQPDSVTFVKTQTTIPISNIFLFLGWAFNPGDREISPESLEKWMRRSDFVGYQERTSFGDGSFEIPFGDGSFEIPNPSE